MSQSRPSLSGKDSHPHSLTQPTQYAFPILKIPELLSIMNELCPDMLLATDFKNTTCDRIKPVYQQLTKLLFTTMHSGNDMPSFTDLLQHDNSDSNSIVQPYDDTISEIKQMKNILYSMRACGVYDCTLNDIIQPDSVRTKKILSAFINYARFREEKLSLYTQYSEQTEQLIDDKYNAEQTNTELTNKLSQLEQQSLIDTPIIQQLTSDITQYTSELESVRLQYDTIKQWIDINTSTLQSDQAMHQQSLNKRSQLQNENIRINGFIIKDPEKLKSQVSDNSAQLNTIKTQLTEQNQIIRDKNNKLVSVNKTSDKLSERIESMNELHELMKKYKKLTHVTHDQQIECDRIELNYQQLLSDEQRLKKLLQQNTDKLVTLHTQYETKRVKAQLALEQIQAEKNDVSRFIDSEQGKITQAELQMNNKQNEFNEIINQHDQTIIQLKSKYTHLQNILQSYHQQLFQQMAQQPLQNITAI